MDVILPEKEYISGMKRKMTTFSMEGKVFFIGLAYLLVIGIILMIQNYIRYGHFAEYNPLPTINHLCIGLLLFSLFLPGFFRLSYWIKDKYPRQYWILASFLLLLVVAVFYALSSGIMFILGLKDSFFNVSFARFYFGRVVFFHILMLLFIMAYIFYKKEEIGAKQISGTIGRKKITIKASLARWIEADDHYLRIHLDEGIMLKRSTLDQMTKELTPEFVRIHRKYLVNKDLVIGREKNKRDEYLILTTGERLKVGRSYSPINW